MQLLLIRLITRDVFVVSAGVIRYINLTMQKLSIICKQIGKTIFFAIKLTWAYKISDLAYSQSALLSSHLEDSSAEKQCNFMEQEGIPISIYLDPHLCLFTFYWVSGGYWVWLHYWERSGKSALNWLFFHTDHVFSKTVSYMSLRYFAVLS